MSYEPKKVGSVKVGRYVNDPDTGEPCRIISIDKSKPGKHGAAKARIMMVGLFDGKKRQIVSPVDQRINVPLIDKRNGQVTNIESDGLISVMDSETYETFPALPPDEEDIKKNLERLFKEGKGIEIEYWNVMDRKKVVNVKEMEF